MHRRIWTPDGSSESVADPSRNQWLQYTGECASHDYQFEMTASGTYYLRFYLMDKTAGVYYLRANVFASANDNAYPAVSAIVKSAVDKCNAETDGSDYVRALWLHDWTLDQLEYDYNLNWCSAESGLTRHQGTCESYQRIYAKLLNAAGIANGRITGNGHTWNAVKIDGKWCQMDLTWDDTNDNWYGDLDQRHLYFGLTDELMAIAHSDHTANYQTEGYAYRSTDLTNNYFVRNGKADEWASQYADRIQQHLDARETEFSIDADNQSIPPSISGIQNDIVAYAINQREWSGADGSATLTATSNVTTVSSYEWSAKLDFEVQYISSIRNGWSKLNDDAICYYKDGELLKGEAKIDGKWYYFDSNSGILVTGFVLLPDGRTVYYSDEGHMLYGEQIVDGSWRYFDPLNGAMARSSFVDLGTKTCYYDEQGRMVYGERNIGGCWFCFYDETGAMAKGLSDLPDGRTVYYSDEGHMLYGEQIVDGSWRYFDPLNGAMARSSFVDLGTKTCYYDEQGRMVYGERNIGGKDYYFEYWTGALMKERE